MGKGRDGGKTGKKQKKGKTDDYSGHYVIARPNAARWNTARWCQKYIFTDFQLILFDSLKNYFKVSHTKLCWYHCLSFFHIIT